MRPYPLPYAPSAVARFLAYFLSTLILLQTFSRELLVLDYQVHKERITEMFCVNKAKPLLQCNGKCHLGKQLRKAADAESKAPAAGFAKVKFELLAPLTLRLTAPRHWSSDLVIFAPQQPAHYTFAPLGGIFHPPSLA